MKLHRGQLRITTLPLMLYVISNQERYPDFDVELHHVSVGAVVLVIGSRAFLVGELQAFDDRHGLVEVFDGRIIATTAQFELIERSSALD